LRKQRAKSKIIMAKVNLIIRSNVKKVLPEEMRLGVKVPDRLNEVIEEKIRQAVERAKANKRTTILPQDI
jgi:histone H3/H4